MAKRNQILACDDAVTSFSTALVDARRAAAIFALSFVKTGADTSEGSAFAATIQKRG